MMDLLNNIYQLTPEQRKLVEELLKKQGVDIGKLLNNEQKYNNINVTEEKEYYEMSSAQKRLFVFNQLEGDSITYNMPCYLDIEGKLDKEKFQWIFNVLINRHEGLRTSFYSIDKKLVQKINDNISFELECVEIEEKDIINKFKDFIKPFDLSVAPLMRAKLFKISDERHILAFDIHHIISDGVTMSIIIDEVSKLYGEQELPKLKLQYKDFAEWQNNQINEEKFIEQEKYWVNKFKDSIPLLDMPVEYQRSDLQNFKGESFYFKSSEGLTKKLNDFAKENGCTLYIVLLAVYNLLLSKYSGQKDIVVGCPVAGRCHADLERVVGMFVNIIAIRNYPDSEKTFINFLKEVKYNSLKDFENQDYQFEMLVEKLNIKRDLSKHPLFDTVFVMQNTGSRDLKINGLKITPFDIESNTSKFDITLNVDERKNLLNFKLEYKTSLYSKEFMSRLSKHYLNLLENIIKNPYEKLSDIEILSELEKHQIFESFNSMMCGYPIDKTIQDIFEEQVNKYSGATRCNMKSIA